MEKSINFENKYKVIDIQNEAPDFIKQIKTLIEKLGGQIRINNRENNKEGVFFSFSLAKFHAL